MSNEPEIRTHDIGPEDHFLLLACDGLWDVMNNIDAAEYVQQRLAGGMTVDGVVEDLVDAVYMLGAEKRRKESAAGGDDREG